jgi:hypothetical protein
MENRHPVDELADIRAKRMRLKARAGETGRGANCRAN